MDKRFYKPEKLNGDWRAAVDHHRPLIEAADTADGFEKSMSDLLAELHTSHLGFFHGSARRASSRAALSATYLADETPFGERWIFQDVHSGGAASNAGIESGDILLSVEGREIAPPEHPVFVMGKQTSLEIVGRDDQRRAVPVDVARPKGADAILAGDGLQTRNRYIQSRWLRRLRSKESELHLARLTGLCRERERQHGGLRWVCSDL